MALPSSCRGPLKAIMLAGFIVQLVQAQETRIFLKEEPPNPKVGQEVTLSPQGAPSPSQITLCEWSREDTLGPSGEILGYAQFEQNRDISNGSAYTGRETLYQNCSLHIQELTQMDTGNYTVVIETQQSGREQQGEPKVLHGDIYLQVYAPEQRISTIAVDPQFPKKGQGVTLTPQGTFKPVTFCQWSIQNGLGRTVPIVKQIPGERVQQIDSAYRDRVVVGEACSLKITNLRSTDTNNYTVTIRVPQKQLQQPGQKDHSQGELDQEYVGHVYLRIAEQQTGGAKGSSASLSYSAGVITGALLGSLAWADALISLFSVLLGSFISWRPKLFP